MEGILIFKISIWDFQNKSDDYLYLETVYSVDTNHLIRWEILNGYSVKKIYILNLSIKDFWCTKDYYVLFNLNV